MNSLGPNLWISHDWKYRYASVGHRYLEKKGRSMNQKTSQYLVWPPFASMTCATLSHSYSIAVQSCWILAGTGTVLYMSIQSIPNMVNGWHVCWVCRPWKNWDIFSFQELCTDPWDTRPYIIMLKHEVMDGMIMGLRISSRYLCAFKLPSIKCNCVCCL